MKEELRRKANNANIVEVVIHEKLRTVLHKRRFEVKASEDVSSNVRHFLGTRFLPYGICLRQHILGYPMGCPMAMSVAGSTEIESSNCGLCRVNFVYLFGYGTSLITNSFL